MNIPISKYALIHGQEATLSESISHAAKDESIIVFQDSSGSRRYVTLAEWEAGSKDFARHAIQRHIVTSESSTKEKIELFRSLFRGREDVYAHGFAKKQGGIGYSPACANERTRKCPRWTRSSPRIKCADCPAREFIPINNRALVEHFKGSSTDLHDVIGIYVVTPDCKTWMLVADFDKDGWKAEAKAYRDSCRYFGLTPALEISRSGNGAHVWLFFDEPIDASVARNLGCALITHAMNVATGITFKSYDRLFPTQSTIPEGGFGNLIALPFQGRAQKDSRSVFADDDFMPFPDQWRFLSSISKATVSQVEKIIDSVPNSPLGELATTDRTNRSSEKHAKLSLRFSSSRTDDATQNEFPERINIIKANMLYVSKGGISNKVLNKLRRLAAFGNPEFFRAQAMHQSVYGKNRIIWCGEENDDYIMLPRGCEQKLIELARRHRCAISFSDHRNHTTPIEAKYAGTLRQRQQDAANELLHHENGILVAPTGFGKTVIGAYLIGKLKVKTLIIVPKTTLLCQWKTKLEQFLSITDNRPPLLTKSGKPSKRKRSTIGQIGGGKLDVSGIVDVATFQSLSIKDELGVLQVKPIVRDYDLVICDECHHGAAPNLELILKSVNARYVYGLSATPKRADGLEQIIYMHCGPIRCSVSAKEQLAEQGFKRILNPRFTRIRLAALEPGASFNQVVYLLCKHKTRNRLIVEDAIAAVKLGHTPLILTQRKEHAAELARLLRETDIHTFVLTGDGTTSEKRDIIQEIHNSSHISYAIVATGSYVGEGFDLPRLDTLLLASPYSWEGVITQYSGRLHRENEGKDTVAIYDYVDTSIPMLERMYKKRLKTYAKLGYEIANPADAQDAEARIISADTWRAEFTKEFSHINKNVFISVPYAAPALLEALKPAISDAIARGVEIGIFIKTPRSEQSQLLQSDIAESLAALGCKAYICDSVPTGIAIFDSKNVWYGTLPLLAFAKSDDCSLRIENAEIAHDLEKVLSDALEAYSENEDEVNRQFN